MNDIKRLKDEADISRVVDYLGLGEKRTGGYTFLPCPLPEHDDRHATNCYFKQGWNHVYCSVCCKSIMAVDLIMHATGLDYGESCDVLWNLEGQPDWYYDKEKGKKTDSFCITQRELDFLGIKLKSSVDMPVREYTSKPFLGDDIPRRFILSSNGQGYLLLKRKSGLSWKDFLSEHAMKQLVLKKCDEKKKLLEMAENFTSRLGVTDVFAEERKLVESLRRRAQVHERSKVRKAV